MDTAEINKIKEQFQNGLWPQFLETIQINGLRGWQGETINFNFPIVAIVGENGAGKSTVLKTAACAYKGNDESRTFYPSKFFIDTHWDRIQNVVINYRIRLGNDIKTFRVSKKTQKWGFPEKNYSRNVYMLDISRTVPLDATVGYAKIAKQAVEEISSSELDPEYLKWLSYILGREYINARFAKTDLSGEREVGLLERDFGEISQFHQGAGEDTTHDLFKIFQSIPSHSLIIIDEIENSLHPKAQRRLIRFLLWLSRQKRIQIILSTHSPYVLEELPREARILLLPSNSRTNVVYGVTPEFAMSRIDENDHPALHLFVEDRESEIFLREIIASHPKGQSILSQVDFSIVGPANVVYLLGNLAENQKLPYKGLGIVDGDYDEAPGCIKLPGTEAPEKVIFGALKELNWPDLPERFGIGAGTLFMYLEDAILNPDHHQWASLIGDKIRMSSISVWNLLVKQWCKHCLTETEQNRIISKLQELLGLE
ncbi:MAG TPA: AAA family ATPase [Bacillota bacterium]|nr:AAA family ATPase [Bacillota bacterium]